MAKPPNGPKSLPVCPKAGTFSFLFALYINDLPKISPRTVCSMLTIKNYFAKSKPRLMRGSCRRISIAPGARRGGVQQPACRADSHPRGAGDGDLPIERGAGASPLHPPAHGFEVRPTATAERSGRPGDRPGCRHLAAPALPW